MNIIIILLLVLILPILLGSLLLYYLFKSKIFNPTGEKTKYYRCLSFSAAYILVVGVLSAFVSLIFPTLIAIIISFIIYFSVAYYLIKYYFFIIDKKILVRMVLIWLLFVFLISAIMQFSLVKLNPNKVVAPDEAKSMVNVYFMFKENSTLKDTQVNQDIVNILNKTNIINYTLDEQVLFSRNNLNINIFLNEDKASLKEQFNEFNNFNWVENESVYLSYVSEKYLIKAS